METVTPNESLAEVVNKIEAAAYDVCILEMIYLCKRLKERIKFLTRNNDIVLDMEADQRSQEFIEGYLHTSDIWNESMNDKIEEIQIKIFQHMGIHWVYRYRAQAFKDAFNEYKDNKIDVDGLFSAFKKIARGLYVRA